MNGEKLDAPNLITRRPFLIRNPWFSIFLVIILYFLFQFIPQIIYSIFTVSLSIEPKLYLMQIINFLSLGILLLVLVPFVFRIPNSNKNYSEYMRDIQVLGTSVKAVVVGLLTTVIIFICALGSSFLTVISSKMYFNWMGVVLPEDPKLVVDPSYLLNPNVLMNVYYMINPGVWEEIAFRGIILGILVKKYRFKTAIVIDGIIFGLYHLVNLIDPALAYSMGLIGQDYFLIIITQTVFQVVYASCLGALWAILFIKSKSIIPCILAHWLVDAFGGLVWTITNSVPGIYLISLTLLGIGVLPLFLNIFVLNRFYPKMDNEISSKNM